MPAWDALRPEPNRNRAGERRRRSDLPSTEELAFIGGIGLLAAVGVLEWPIAATLAVGHLFASSRHNKVLRDFGSVLEEA